MTTLTDATNSVSTYIVENQVGGITAAILNTVLTTTINAVSGAVAQFESGFQGALATDPTGDLGGNPLTASAWYYNTTTSQVKVYTTGVWTAVIQSANFQGVRLAIRNLNLNATGDTAVTIPLPTGISNYNVSAIRLTNSQTSAPSSTARIGVYSAASLGGTALVTQQAINTLSLFSAGVSTNVLALTLALGASTALNYATLYVNVGTANGAAATADVIISINFY